jgi:hypothetical protein
MSEWVSVKDRLPEVEIGVLIYTILGDIEIALLNPPDCDGPFWYYPEDNGWDEDDVSHWMLLPAPPKDNTASDISEK